MSFRPLAEQILRDIDPKIRLSEDATIIINQLMSLITYQIQPINTVDQLRNIIGQILPGQLASLANSELDKTITQLKDNVSVATQIESGKNAIYKYLLTEILEISGNIAKENNANSIDSYIIITAIMNDNELNQVFQTTIPKFPYGNSIDIASIVRSQTKNYNVVPGFILALQDYVRTVLEGNQNATVDQLNQLSQRFGNKNPQYTTVPSARRGLAESIISYIINNIISGKQNKNNEEIGFMDILTALQNLK